MPFYLHIAEKCRKLAFADMKREYMLNDNETNRHLQVTNTHAKRYENRRTYPIEKRPAYTFNENNENETSRHLQVTNTHAERYENRHTYIFNEKRPTYIFNENETSRHLQVTKSHAKRYENKPTYQIEKRPTYYIFRWERSARLSTCALMKNKQYCC